MVRKADIDNIIYYMEKGEVINIGQVIYYGKKSNLKIGLFSKKDAVNNKKLLSCFGAFYHVLDDGIAYFKIICEDGEEIAFYEPEGSLYEFSVDIIGDRTTISKVSYKRIQQVELEMTTEQANSVKKNLLAINEIIKNRYALNNAKSKEYGKVEFVSHEEICFRWLVKLGDFDEVTRPFQQEKGKKQCDIHAYKYSGEQVGKHLFECKCAEILPKDINKLAELITTENAVCGTIIGTKGIHYIADEIAKENKIRVLRKYEQIDSMSKIGLIVPTRISETINVSILLCKHKENAKYLIIQQLNNQLDVLIEWIKNGLSNKELIKEIIEDIPLLYNPLYIEDNTKIIDKRDELREYCNQQGYI